MNHLPDILLIAGTSAFTLLVVLGLVYFGLPKPAPALTDDLRSYGDISLSFVGDTCVEASHSTLELLGAETTKDISFAATISALSLRFDALVALLDDHASYASEGNAAKLEETLISSVHHDKAQLKVLVVGASCFLHIVDPAIPSSADRHRAMTGKARLKLIFESLNKVPHPVWVASQTGQLTWSNRAYDALGMSGDRQTPAFNVDAERALHGNGDRVSFSDPRKGGETHWYDVSIVEIEQGNYFNYAINVDGVIAAETAQRKFVQTLAKTFAQLSIGLAIFDRDRRLVLFNPALVDLTALPAHVLSTQPNLQSFFDKLREGRIMPEPRDYATWRRQIADLVVKSTDGDYQETWGLPSGLTYRVTGRPHPDGAIAILIEDITAEITLTRRFKGQIELANSALETSNDAIVVFNSDGAVAFWNSAFKAFCRLPNSAKLSEHSLQSLNNLYVNNFSEGPELDKLKSALRSAGDMGNTKGRITLKAGAPLNYEIRTHEGTATIVSFHTSQLPARTALPELTQVN